MRECWIANNNSNNNEEEKNDKKQQHQCKSFKSRDKLKQTKDRQAAGNQAGKSASSVDNATMWTDK